MTVFGRPSQVTDAETARKNRLPEMPKTGKKIFTVSRSEYLGCLVWLQRADMAATVCCDRWGWLVGSPPVDASSTQILAAASRLW